MQTNSIRTWVMVTIFCLALIGFADATYLTVEHYIGGIPPCAEGFDCEKVTTSEYSKILGIPVALLGSLYYFTILLASIVYFDTRKKVVALGIFALAPLGLLSAVWFTSLQLFVIKALCPYCLLSAGTSTLIFIFAIIGYRLYKTNDIQTVDPVQTTSV